MTIGSTVQGVLDSAAVGKIMAAFDGNIDPMITMAGAVAFLIGFAMMLMAIKMGIETSKGQNNGRGGYVGAGVLFFVGVALINFPEFLDSMRESLFDSKSSPLSYQTSVKGMGAQASSTIVVLLHFLQLVGVLAVIKGLIIFSKLSNGGGQDVSLGKGLTFVLAGALACNIVLTVNMLSESLGLGFSVG